MKELYEIEPHEFYIEERDYNQNGDYIFTLIPVEKLTECPWCGSSHIIDYGTRKRQVRDLNMFGKHVGINLKNYRYRCKDCESVFVNRFQSIDDNAKITNRLRDYIKEQSLNRPFSHIASDLNVGTTTIRRIFLDYVAELDKKHVLKAPKVLGIDENHLKKIPRGIFTDIINGSVLEITADRTKKTVKETIVSMEGWEDIGCFTMDMCREYRSAVYELNPDAVVIVDKFHVIKQVNDALTAVRRGLNSRLSDKERLKLKRSRDLLRANIEDIDFKGQLRLKELFEMYPVLEKGHTLKEHMRNIFLDCTSRAEAESAFESWKSLAHEYDIPEFIEIGDTIDRWHKEVFNYFENRYTNATTEALNRVINCIDEAGSGYCFEVLRYKIIYGTRASKPHRFEYVDTGANRIYGNFNPGRLSMVTPFVPTKKKVLADGDHTDICELEDEVRHGQFFFFFDEQEQ